MVLKIIRNRTVIENFNDARINELEKREFDEYQVALDINDMIEIRVNNNIIKSFTAKYPDCKIAFTWNDQKFKE